jgi:hypothetical protein
MKRRDKKITIVINKETGETFTPVFLTATQVESIMNPPLKNGETLTVGDNNGTA